MGNFDWKIWSWKLLKGLGIVVGASGALYVADFIIENPLPPEYAFYGGLVVVVLQAFGNFIKHQYLSEALIKDGE